MRGPVNRLLVAASAGLFASVAVLSAQAPAPAPTTRFYTRGGLRLESYLYLPPGAGPAPLVVYNHGSRAGAERAERPLPGSRAFSRRRGTPCSSRNAGATANRRAPPSPRTSAAIAAHGSSRASRRKQTMPWRRWTTSWRRTDRASIAADWLSWGGRSGGIVAVIGGAKRPAFRALVAQAPGALNWDRSAALRETLLDAAERLRMPVQCLVAANDATVESAKQICARAKAAGAPAVFTLYPAFTPPSSSDTPRATCCSARTASVSGKRTSSRSSTHP